MAAKVFLDTAYAIALSSFKDIHHGRALRLAEKLRADKSKIVTTRAILLEIGNALSKQRYRAAAIRLLVALESDPSIEIVPLTEHLYLRALQLYQEREDKEWGLTDCISFVVMGDEKVYEALTTDEHFRQAGFRPLLLEESQ
jgi:predicted nucleic acid-binding protein